MQTDKEILYSMIEREVDNIMCRNPWLSMFSDYASKMIINYIDPYVDAFTSQGRIMDDKATTYLTEETIEKINKFKERFIQEREHEKE